MQLPPPLLSHHDSWKPKRKGPGQEPEAAERTKRKQPPLFTRAPFRLTLISHAETQDHYVRIPVPARKGGCRGHHARKATTGYVFSFGPCDPDPDPVFGPIAQCTADLSCLQPTSDARQKRRKRNSLTEAFRVQLEICQLISKALLSSCLHRIIPVAGR